MRILITGGNGQLGIALKQVITSEKLLLTDTDNMDITKPEQIAAVFEDFKPEFLIHGAAYTNVDGAEENPELARLVNATGTQNLVVACEKADIPMIYISSDYTFDGTATEPIPEDAKPNPISVYGKTKLEGEVSTMTLRQGYVLRTSWVYGEGKNFVRTMLALADKMDEIKVVNDQFGRPTYAVDLAKAIYDVITKRPEPGIYNVTGDGDIISWADFAREIFKIAGKNIKVVGISTEEYLADKLDKKIAPRPKYSALDLAKAKKNGLAIFDWKKSITKYLKDNQANFAIQSPYKNKNILVTGGDGFIGSNLVKRLLKEGAKVTVFLLESNSSFFSKNERVNTVFGDIRDEKLVEKATKKADYIFHLCGLSGAAESNQRAILDLDINCKGLLNILEASRKNNRGVRILFPSSQLVYGKIDSISVKEDDLTEPTSIYGAHKLVCEKYCRIYFDAFAVKTTVLRIPNPYGPGQKPGQKYGIVNYFINQIADGKPISIFGNGEQIRDYIYINDLIDIMLLANSSENSTGQVYNVGGPEISTLKQMAETIIHCMNSGELTTIPFPQDFASTEVGNIFLDKNKIAKSLDWKPRVSLEEGIKDTIKILRNKK